VYAAGERSGWTRVDCESPIDEEFPVVVAVVVVVVAVAVAESLFVDEVSSCLGETCTES